MVAPDLKTHRQIEMIESGLTLLSQRLPEVPVQGVLLCRLLMFLGRDMGAMLDQPSGRWASPRRSFAC